MIGLATKPTLNAIIVLLVLPVAVIPLAAQNNDSGSPVLYLGQKPPGKIAEPFAPEVLTLEPHDAPVIMHDDALIIVGTMEEGVVFYMMTNGELALTSDPLGCDIPDICQGIAVSPSKNRLYIRDWNSGNGYFYFIDKTDDGWTSRKSLGDDVNSVDTHWQFTVAENENLYFMARGRGIVVSVFDGNAHLEPVSVKLEDDSDLQGGTPFIAPDESYLIFCEDDDLQITYRLNNGKWTTPQSLGPNVNSDQLDLCPMISPNGKYLFFVTRRDGPDFVTYWADASFVEDLKPEDFQ